MPLLSLHLCQEGNVYGISVSRWQCFLYVFEIKFAFSARSANLELVLILFLEDTLANWMERRKKEAIEVS